MATATAAGSYVAGAAAPKTATASGSYAAAAVVVAPKTATASGSYRAAARSASASGSYVAYTAAGLYRRTGPTTAVRERLLRRTGLTTVADFGVVPAAPAAPPAAAPTLTPTASPRGWWKADALTSPPADGGNMVSFTDAAAAPHPFLIVDGNPPVYRASGSFLPNAKPVIEFTASNSQDMTAAVANNTATTKFFVFRLKTLPAAGVFALYGGAGGLQVNVNPAGKVTVVNSGQFGLITGGAATLTVGTWYVVAATSDGTTTVSYVNGTQDATSSIATTFTATSATVGSPATGGDFLNGYIAEILDYSRVLTGAEITQTTDYLTAKYGVSAATSLAAPTAGWWSADLAGVPAGSMGSSRDDSGATAVALRRQWDYWDQAGGSVVSPATEGIPAPPSSTGVVIKWQKPAGTTGAADQVYQKMNRTFTANNWPGAVSNNGSSVPAAPSPADISGQYVTHRYLPSSDLVLNPPHGWLVLMSFKENYRDAGGGFHQDGTGWKIGGDNISGGPIRLSMTSKASILLSSVLDRWVRWEYRIYQGAKDLTGHGGRIEWWLDGVLIDTGYEGDPVEGTPLPTGHIGPASYCPINQTEGLIWTVGQYTSNQTTNGTPDYVGTHMTSYIGPSWVSPLAAG